MLMASSYIRTLASPLHIAVWVYSWLLTDPLFANLTSHDCLSAFSPRVSKSALGRAIKAALSARNIGILIRPTFLTSDEDQILASDVLERHRVGASMTIREVISRAEEMRRERNEVSGVLVCPSHPTLSMAWPYRFFQRLDLRVWIPSALDADRYVVSQIDVLSYFRTLEELNSLYSYYPRNISNMDESQFFQGKKRSRMMAVANVSAHQVYRMHATSSMLITTSATIAANGQALEPLLIVPRKTLPHDVLAEAEVLKMSLVYSESGWMTRCIFDDWVEHMFIPEAVSSGMVLTS